MLTNDILNAIGLGATKLLTLVAGAEASVHNLEANDPLVGQAIALAVKEVGTFPAATQVLSIGKAVLGLAQMMASMTQAAGMQAIAQKSAVS
jgi:hypothetical protein